MPFSDYKTALVTGASSGIGRATVVRLAKEGLKIHALARSEEKLKKLNQETGCQIVALDVADTSALSNWLKAHEFDILINCAGIDTPRKFLESNMQDIDQQIDINLRSILHLCRLIVPGMVKRNCGHVINVTSIAGNYNFGGNSIYHAVKAGVAMLTSQLRVDCFGHQVRISELCPGRVATDIFAHVHGASDETHARFIDGFELPQPQDIAETIAFIINAPRAVNFGHVEITPTLQVMGGLQTTKPADL